MFNKFMRVIFLFLLTFLSIQSFSQGKLDKSKEEVKKGTKKETNTGNQHSSSSSSTSEDESLGEIIMKGIAEVFLYITYYSTIGNYSTEKHLSNKVTKYPYYNKRSGNYESTDSGFHTKNHFRFDLDYQFLYSNKNLVGNHFKCNIRPFQYFYLQAEYHALTEHNNDSSHSKLSMFNFNFCYDRLRFEKFNLGWKLGMCYISNNVNAGGFSGGLDAEAFLIKPFSLCASKQWGAIHGVAVNEFELAGKYHLKRFKIQLGYEHLKIGSPVYNYIFLGAGIRL